MLLAAASPSSTTAIPTWLALLAPLLAALVSGTAGTVGALLGGRTSAGTAERIAERTAAINERLRARDWANEMWRWNHERRERAYTALLAARDGQIRRMHDDQLADGERYVVSDQVVDAFAQVELFGSETARKAAERWDEVIFDLLLHSTPVGDPPASDPKRGELALQEAEHRAQFVALIRGELRVNDR